MKMQYSYPHRNMTNSQEQNENSRSNQTVRSKDMRSGRDSFLLQVRVLLHGRERSACTSHSHVTAVAAEVTGWGRCIVCISLLGGIKALIQKICNDSCATRLIQPIVCLSIALVTHTFSSTNLVLQRCWSIGQPCTQTSYCVTCLLFQICGSLFAAKKRQASVSTWLFYRPYDKDHRRSHTEAITIQTRD